LKNSLQSIDLDKQLVEHHLEQALRAGEQLREDRDSIKLAALLKGQEVESLSREVARLIRQSFAKGNEIADLKEQCNERQAEIERLNEVIAPF
jgi:predicted  nucleic acid-binding Zn-ribbon protein